MMYLPSSEGFLGLTGQDACDPARAKAVIIPFPLEASVSYEGGTGQGPGAILTASHQVELFDEHLWSEPFRDYGVATLQPPAISSDLASAMDQIADLVGQQLAAGRFPLTLGGEHSLTAGAIRGVAKHIGEVVILQVDAHADLRDGYEGEAFSHAAAMRRCLDVPGVSLVSVGIRNISAEEIPFLERHKARITIHWAKDRARWDWDAIVAPLKGKSIYLTVDLDGFDSSLMPATGTPEPGGLFWDDMMALLEAASKAGTIVAADIVELAPRPGLHACDFLAAKLGYKILNYALSPS